MNTKKLAIIILGNRDSGKSNTFYELFGRRIKTGWKKLPLEGKYIETFIKNSSFEETGQKIDDNIFVRNGSFEEMGDNIETDPNINQFPSIIFCAVQYIEKGLSTIEYFRKNGYYLYIQWLNPGYKDKQEYADYLKFEEKFSSAGKFYKVSGKEKTERVEQLKQFLINWILN